MRIYLPLPCAWHGLSQKRSSGIGIAEKVRDSKSTIFTLLLNPILRKGVPSGYQSTYLQLPKSIGATT